jgi:hypothetical protein
MKTRRMRFHRRIVGKSRAEASSLSCQSVTVEDVHNYTLTDNLCQTIGKGSVIICNMLTPRCMKGR